MHMDPKSKRNIVLQQPPTPKRLPAASALPTTQSPMNLTAFHTPLVTTLPAQLQQWGFLQVCQLNRRHCCSADLGWGGKESTGKSSTLGLDAHPLSDSRHTTGVSVGSEVSLAACWASTEMTPACSSESVPRPARGEMWAEPMHTVMRGSSPSLFPQGCELT